MTAADQPTNGLTVFGHTPEIVHVGYSVENLRSAISYWTSVFGAGPFFTMENVSFDWMERPDGEEAVFDHSCAFGQWGDLVVELHEMHRVEPADLHAKVAGSSNQFNHVAYFATDPEAESERLEELGIPLILRAGVGPVEMRWHHAPWLGHVLEIHKDTEHVRKRHAMYGEAAKDWDGSDPIRPMPTPPGAAEK